MSVTLPLAILAVATVGLALGVEPIPSWYYHCAWWPYIFAADALNRRLGGCSLIRDRPRELGWLAAVSATWWTMFEAINLRLGNWYYVMNHPSRAARWIGGCLAFATVLPGILVTLRLVERVGWLQRIRVAPLNWSRRKSSGCVLLGVACLCLPLIWPELFFPLTWGSFVFLLEPWNRRHARRCFLRDLEAGEAGPFCRTLLAGLACGLLWESLNFWARTRWIYTVPGFEDLKLFEMPLLGFLGFPPFAVECLVVLRFLEAQRQRLGGWRRSTRRVASLAAATMAASGTALVFWLAAPITTDSYHASVGELAVLPKPHREQLSRLGLVAPERLVAVLSTSQGLGEWSTRSGLSESELVASRERVALVLHRGLGLDRALQLEALGIRTRDDLRVWTSAELAAGLRALKPGRVDPFLDRRARVWVGR